MPIIDDARLREILTTWEGVLDLELEGIIETPTHLRLGHVSVHQTQPSFTYTIPQELDDMSYFRRQPFELPDHGISGTAVVFHAADHPDDRTKAPEYFVGWVRAERDAELEAWRARMNAHVADLLYERSDKSKEHAQAVEIGPDTLP